MNLAISLRSEIIKTKRTAAFYLTLVAAAAVPVVFLLNILLSDGFNSVRKDPLNALFKLNAEANGLGFFPWFIILICTLLPQLEYRNNTWKQVLASPQAKLNLMMAKFLNIQFLLLLFLVSTHLFMFIAIVVGNFIDPSLGLFSHPLDGQTVLLKAGNAYVTMLAICTIQFWLGLRFKNFIVPIAIGLACWLAGTMLAFEFKSSLANYFPYSFQAFYLSPIHNSHINQVVWTSIGYTVLFLAACFFDFRRREINK